MWVNDSIYISDTDESESEENFTSEMEVDSTRPDAAAEVQNELLINMLDLIDQLSNRLQAVEALLHTTSNNTGERPANEQQQLSNSE